MLLSALNHNCNTVKNKNGIPAAPFSVHTFVKVIKIPVT